MPKNLDKEIKKTKKKIHKHKKKLQHLEEVQENHCRLIARAWMHRNGVKYEVETKTLEQVAEELGLDLEEES